MTFESKKNKSFEDIQKKEYARILAKETKKQASEEARKQYLKEFEPKKLKKEEREKKLKPVKEAVKKVGKYIPQGSLGHSKVLSTRHVSTRQEAIRKHFNEPIRQNVPYHVDMQADRDNGFRPHIAQSLVKTPDIEGYKRNLLLQPSKNIWEEPRKRNVWDDTFNPIEKKKSIFEK